MKCYCRLVSESIWPYNIVSMSFFPSAADVDGAASSFQEMVKSGVFEYDVRELINRNLEKLIFEEILSRINTPL